MSLSESEPEEDKAGLLSTESRSLNNDSRATTPTPSNIERKRFLPVPLTGPIRPLSPDLLSNFSVDEYDQIRPRHLSRERPSGLKSVPLRRGWRGRLDAFWNRNAGIAYMIVAQAFGVIMNTFTRLLEIEGNKGKGLHPAQILFARMSITLVLCCSYMYSKKTPTFPLGMPEVRWLLVARGFGGFFGIYGMYEALRSLSLADATVITFLAPSIACWACSILINEPFTRVEQIAGLISLVGVGLIAKPTSLVAAFGTGVDETVESDGDVGFGTNITVPGESDASNYADVTPAQRLTAVIFALLGVLGSAVAYTTIRWIGKRAHPLISVNYFAAWCTLVSIILQLSLKDVGFLLPADLKEWTYLFFLGICGFIMQFLLASGLSYEKSSRATNMVYVQALFALGADKIFFGHTPDLMSIAGSTLILGSAIYVATQSSVSGPEEQSRGSHMTTADEESQEGLISGMADVRSGEDHDRIPMHEIQARAVR